MSVIKICLRWNFAPLFMLYFILILDDSICGFDRGKETLISKLQKFRSVLTLGKSTAYRYYNNDFKGSTEVQTLNLLRKRIYTSIAIKLQFMAVDRFQTINLMRNLNRIYPN